MIRKFAPQALNITLTKAKIGKFCPTVCCRKISVLNINIGTKIVGHGYCGESPK